MNSLRPAQNELTHLEAEEVALWQALSSNEQMAARQALFRRYEFLARRVAWQFRHRNARTPVELAELQQLASVGLLEAIDSYRPDRGVPFRYYSPRRIAGAISDGLARHSEINQQINTARRIQRERARSLLAGRKAGKGLASKLDVLGEIAAELALGLMLDDSALILVDECDRRPDAFETLAWQQALQQLRSTLETMADPPRAVITWHYIDGLPFEAVARMMGLSKGRISQIHRQGLELLRKRLRSTDQLRLEG